MFAFKTKPQSLTEIFTSGLSLYWASFKSVVIWSLMLAIICEVATLFYVRIVPFRNNISYIHWPNIATLTGLMLVMLLITSFISGIMIHQIYLVGTQTRTTLAESARTVFKKFHLLVFASIISSFLVGLGLSLFFVPGVFMAIILVFVLPLILLDDHSIFEAYRYSWFLVWKSWWRTFAVLLPPMVLFIAYLPQPSVNEPSLLSLSLDGLRVMLVLPLLLSMLLTMFYDAKLRHHVAMHLPKKKNGSRAESKRSR